jgi:hypothetical protein
VARVGLHLGPLHISGRLGGRSERDREADAALFAGLLIVGVVVSFFGFAPWAAVQAVSGRWGVTATVLGVLFIAASLGSVLWPSYGLLFGTSWGLYCTYLVGYWTLAGQLTSWLPDGQPQVNSLDDYVLGLLTIIGILVEGVALLGVAIIASYVLAHLVVSAVCKVRGRETPAMLRL